MYMKSLEERKQEFIKKAKDKFGDKFDYSRVEYVDYKTKVYIICHEHGGFMVSPISFLRNKNGCPKCALKKQHDNFAFTNEVFINKAKEKFGDKYDYSKVEYINTDTNVLIICPIHGEFYQTPYRHLKSYTGCPKCSILIPHRKRLTEEELIKRFREIHGSKYKYIIEDYKCRRSKIKIICPKHGEYLQTVDEHLDGNGCPKCLLKSQTKVYEKINSIFKNFIFEYSTEWLFPQRFDMYSKEYNIAIEYNGEQHYHPVKRFGGEEGYKICQERDKRKMEKCLQNNCKLFIVRYDHEEEDIRYIINEINKIVKSYEDN